MMPRLSPRRVLALALVALAAASPAASQSPASPTPSAPSAAARAAAEASFSIFTDAAARAHAEAALDATSDLRFADADVHIAAIAAQHPDHPAVPFLRAQSTWWRILLDLSNSGYDATFERQMTAVVRAADARLRRNRRDFDARFFRSVALGYKARLNVNRSQWWPAAREGKAAYDDVLSVARRDPANPDFGFGRGLYDYYAAVARDDYPVARPLLALFRGGSRERGLAALRVAAERGTFTRTEATYFLAQILYVHEGRAADALIQVQALRRRHPGNAYFAAFEGRLLMSTGQIPEARETFEAIVAQFDAGNAAYTGLAEQSLYQLARLDLMENEADAALVRLDRVDVLTARFSDGQSYYRVLGRLRRGMALDLLGRRDEAVAAYEQVLRLRDLSDSHDAARRYLERPYGT